MRVEDVDVDDAYDDEGQESEYDSDETVTYDLEDFIAMGINPTKSTRARPGSEEKVLMLSARYAAGLPLWHDEDCYDHGPRETELMGAHMVQMAAAPIIDLGQDEEGAEEEE
jgi:hypothetical protein